MGPPCPRWERERSESGSGSGLGALEVSGGRRRHGMNLPNAEPASCPPGQVSAAAGNAAVEYVRIACELAVDGKAAAMVTAPLNKESINLGMGTPRRHCCVGASRPSLVSRSPRSGSPNPRELSAASLMITAPTLMVNTMMIGAPMLGRTWRMRVLHLRLVHHRLHNGRKPNHSRTRDESKSRLNRPRPGN